MWLAPDPNQMSAPVNVFGSVEVVGKRDLLVASIA